MEKTNLLRIVSRSFGEWTVLDVGGEVDINSAPELKSAVCDAVDGAAINVALDLTEVNFMDSTGLAALVAGVKTCRERGGAMALVRPNRQIRRILSITGLWKILPTIESTEGLAKIA
ncbi:MAG: STAS domain-containing protein [Actinomycetota bacterium]